MTKKNWLKIEGHSRHRLSPNAQLDLLPMIPSIFSRFDAVTKLALKCDRRSHSIGGEALIMISLRCCNLTRLKLRGCRELTDAGMAAFAKNCTSLKKLSCGSCAFGSGGMNAVLDNCASLEELSVKRLRGLIDGTAAEPIGPGIAAVSLKTICLKELYTGQCFGPLIIRSKNLRTLRLLKCSEKKEVRPRSCPHLSSVLFHVQKKRKLHIVPCSNESPSRSWASETQAVAHSCPL